MEPPRISAELYEAIVDAERAARKAHDLCYADARRHGAGYWLATRLGKVQSVLIHYVVKYAGRHGSPG